jgi:hypothetical protein
MQPQKHEDNPHSQSTETHSAIKDIQQNREALGDRNTALEGNKNQTVKAQKNMNITWTTHRSNHQDLPDVPELELQQG